MELISLLTAALGTAAGKAVAVAAVSAASVGGLAAADVVDVPLPDLSDKPAEVETDATPVEPVTPAEEDEVEDEEAEEAEEDEQAEAVTEVDAETGVPNDSADFGQEVSVIAQSGAGGEVVSEHARTNNPGADRAGQPGAPENAGERQDATVRPEQSYQDNGDAAEPETPEQAEDAGSQADDHRPESAGPPAAAADARP